MEDEEAAYDLSVIPETLATLMFNKMIEKSITEEELVAKLQIALDLGHRFSLGTFQYLEALLVADEHYELANVIKTFINYNFTEDGKNI